MAVQVLAGDGQRRPHPRGLAFDHRQRLAHLAGDYGRHVALEYPGLLGGNLLDRIAEEIAVIQRDARDHARQRPLNHIGGVKPAAEPDFKKHHVRGMP